MMQSGIYCTTLEELDLNAPEKSSAHTEKLKGVLIDTTALN